MKGDPPRWSRDGRPHPRGMRSPWLIRSWSDQVAHDPVAQVFVIVEKKTSFLPCLFGFSRAQPATQCCVNELRELAILPGELWAASPSCSHLFCVDGIDQRHNFEFEWVEELPGFSRNAHQDHISQSASYEESFRDVQSELPTVDEDQTRRTNLSTQGSWIRRRLKDPVEPVAQMTLIPPAGLSKGDGNIAVAIWAREISSFEDNIGVQKPAVGCGTENVRCHVWTRLFLSIDGLGTWHVLAPASDVNGQGVPMIENCVHICVGHAVLALQLLEPGSKLAKPGLLVCHRCMGDVRACI